MSHPALVLIFRRTLSYIVSLNLHVSELMTSIRKKSAFITSASFMIVYTYHHVNEPHYFCNKKNLETNFIQWN